MARKKKERPAKPKTDRVTQRFELRLDRPIEKEVDDYIEALKTKGRYAAFMRDATWLKVALCSGRVDALYDQHPEIVERLSNGQVIIQPPLPTPPTPDLSDLLETIKQQQQTIKDLTDMVTSQRSTGGYQMQSAQPAGLPAVTNQTGKQIAAPNFSLPVFEDDTDLPTIITHKDTKNNANQNFLKGIMGLQ